MVIIAHFTNRHNKWQYMLKYVSTSNVLTTPPESAGTAWKMKLTQRV